MFYWLIQALRPVRWLIVPTIIMATLTGCASGEDPSGRKAITVFAAASLTEAFTELGAAFQKVHPESSVELNFDGSQRLRFQLEHGAQADVFASADRKQMDRARESGSLTGEIVEFASNRLVLVVPDTGTTAELSQGIESSRLGNLGGGAPVESFSDLSRKGVKLALAHPEVPAGSYSRMLIQRMAEDPRYGPEYASSLLANVVTEEPNVRNVLQKVVLGEVDAGFVYLSDARVASDITVIQAPDGAEVVASYTVAALNNSDQPEAADTFISFISSRTGQSILRNHGFGPPAPALDYQYPSSKKAGAFELSQTLSLHPQGAP